MYQGGVGKETGDWNLRQSAESVDHLCAFPGTTNGEKDGTTDRQED
jgi:hypothetical protein